MYKFHHEKVYQIDQSRVRDNLTCSIDVPLQESRSSNVGGQERFHSKVHSLVDETNDI